MVSQYDVLCEIAKKLGKLNKDLCCRLGAIAGGNSCDEPSYTNLCQIDELTSRLDAIVNAVNNIEITAENINLNAEQINLSVDGLEDLVTETNTILTDLTTQLQTPNINHVVVDNFPVNYNNFDVFTVSGTSSMSFPASNNYHSISFTVVDGTASFSVGANTATGLPQGFSQEFTASTTIIDNLTLTGEASNSKIVITTIQ